MYAHISQNTHIEFPESTEIATWTNASSLPGKPIVECWLEVIVRWHLHISSHFWGWSIQPVLTGQKGLLNQCTSTLHQNFSEVSGLPMCDPPPRNESQCARWPFSCFHIFWKQILCFLQWWKPFSNQRTSGWGTCFWIFGTFEKTCFKYWRLLC